jgi:hypothetical protein
LVVSIGSHMLGKHLKLQGLHLKINLRVHQIVTVSLVCLRKFNFIQFVLNHEFAAKQVVKGSNICMVVSEGTRLFDKMIFSVKMVTCN